MAETSHTLTIVIPALNEEEAIGDTLKRCLEARKHICETSSVEDVEIIVVSDGSTDHTEEIACSFEGVTVLAFQKNRGYGAAIKCGFAHGRGDLVSFLDADGTCDPRIFAKLVNALDEQQADLVLGNRMGEESEMPLVRTVGNTIFAALLGVLSKHHVKDTASGMRVIRRAVLPDLYPLPDGLHFTPAMSARVLLEDRLRLVEVSMPYAERTGRSKLSVVKDGLRFLTCIVQAAVAFRPARPLLLTAGVFGLGAVFFGLPPLASYAQHGWFEEWAIYRVLMASLLVTTSAILVCSAVVADRIAATAHQRPPTHLGLTGLVSRFFSRRMRLVGGALLVGAGVAVVWPGLVEYVTHGEVAMHWSRSVLASLFVVLAVVLGATTFLLNMMELIQSQREAVLSVAPPDRIHRGTTGAS